MFQRSLLLLEQVEAYRMPKWEYILECYILQLSPVLFMKMPSPPPPPKKWQIWHINHICKNIILQFHVRDIYIYIYIYIYVHVANRKPATSIGQFWAGKLHLFTDKERVKFQWNVHAPHFPAPKRWSSTHSELQNNMQSQYQLPAPGAASLQQRPWSDHHGKGNLYEPKTFSLYKGCLINKQTTCIVRLCVR